MALSRRDFLAAAGLVVGAGLTGGGVAACGGTHVRRVAAIPDVRLPAAVAGLPVRQHAWQSTEAIDAAGNPVAPTHDRLVFFDVEGTPGPGHVRLLEAALRRLERSYRWGPAGLLFTASWGYPYFASVLRTAAPIPRATALSDFESPSFDDYDLCLHLASNDPSRLIAAEADLREGPYAITPALRWRETRTGFTGAGLPAAHQQVLGIPAGRPVAASSPLYMGFASNLLRNQASEDAVTIPSGPFAQGTTMAVSYMTETLNTWYDNLTQAQRVARMYSPETTVADQLRLTDDAESEPQDLDRAAARYGVIGHSQACARARRDSKPIILRRDFNTDDGGQAGLHFVCLQRDIADFVTTRTAMNANGPQLVNPSVTPTANNGINEYIFVLKRGNYVIPCRPDRSFPLLAGRSAALV